MSKSKRVLAISLILFLVSSGYFLIFFNYGINLCDEGVAPSLAMRALQGEVVGQDYWCREPGELYLTILLFKLFGLNLHVVRLTIVFMTAVAVVFIYLISRRIMPDNFAFLTAVLTLFGPGPYYKRYFLFFTLLNLLILGKYLEKRNLLWLLSSGLVVGITVGFRVDLSLVIMITFFLLIIIQNLYFPIERGEYRQKRAEILRSTIREGLLYTVAASIIVIPMFILYFLPALRNNLHSFSILSRSNIRYWSLPFPQLLPLPRAELPGEHAWLLFERSLFYLPIALYFAIFFLLIHRFISQKVRQIDLYLILFLIFGILIYYRTLLRPDFEHLLQSLPPAYILGCYFLYLLYQKGKILIRWGQKKSWALSLLLTLFLLAIILAFPLTFVANNVCRHGFYFGSIGALGGEHTLLNIPRAKVYCPPHEAEMIGQIVGYIKIHTNPGEKIYSLAYGTMWNFLCERSNPTPYPVLRPEGVWDEGMQRRTIMDIHESRTKYIIYQDLAWDGWEERRFRYYAPLIEAYIRSNYHLEKKISDFDILRRNETTNLYPFVTAKSRDSFDFIVNLSNAEIETLNPNEVRVARFYIRGEGRNVLFEHPPGEVTYKLKIPEKTSLEFGMGIDPAVWSKDGDGVLFEVFLVDDRSQKHRLFSKYIDPKHREADRRWHDEEIDLSAYSGQEVLLSFITSPGPANDRGYDWAGWSEPRIVWEKGEAM